MKFEQFGWDFVTCCLHRCFNFIFFQAVIRTRWRERRYLGTLTQEQKNSNPPENTLNKLKYF